MRGPELYGERQSRAADLSVCGGDRQPVVRQGWREAGRDRRAGDAVGVDDIAVAPKPRLLLQGVGRPLHALRAVCILPRVCQWGDASIQQKKIFLIIITIGLPHPRQAAFTHFTFDHEKRNSEASECSKVRR